MNHKQSVSHDEVMKRKLKARPQFAIEYLKVAIEDTEEPAVFQIALRRMVEARGGIAKIAKAVGVERETLNRILSPRGNPTVSTVIAILKAIGFILTVQPAGSRSPR